MDRTWFIRGSFALLLILLLSPSMSAAEPEGSRFTLSPYIGYTLWDDLADVEDGLIWGGRVGWMATGHLGLEVTYGRSDTSANVAAEGDVKAEHLGVDLMYQILPYQRVNPYIVAGWAQTYFKRDMGTYRKPNGWEAGVGVLVGLHTGDHHRLDLRLEARDIWAKMDPPPPTENDQVHNWIFTGGLTLTLGSPGFHDSDGDGIDDKVDECNDTPMGAHVDARGCPVDSDGDGVYDGLDQCPGTPAGATVDMDGCPKDSDGDGVFDGLDACPGTESGVEVDERGCPVPPPAPPRPELEMLDTGTLHLQNVTFKSNSAELEPSSHATLDELGALLEHWPELEIEIGGHSDNRGADAHNRELSRERAQSVLTYLSTNFPRISAAQYTVKGYGPDQPIADNSTEEGRALNRRVEMKILSRGTLEQEVQD